MFESEEHLNVRGARESETPVSVAGDRRWPEGTMRREKAKEEPFADVRDTGSVAESIFANSVTTTASSSSNSNAEKFMHSLNEELSAIY